MIGIAGNFKTILKTEGLRAAMRWLNDRVPYRFTAIFAFDGDILRNICLIDKENQSITNCSDQPITESLLHLHTPIRRAFQRRPSLAGQPRRGSSQAAKCSVLLRRSTVWH